MSEDHAAAADRLRQLHDSVTDSAADRIAEALKSDAEAHGTFRPGRHVLDRVSGLSGVVISPSAKFPKIFGMFWVQFNDGTVVVRAPRDLFARPTPPTP